jgi:hypothetical protein
MWYRNHLRTARERIISIEIKKLELRERRSRQDRRPRLADRPRPARAAKHIDTSC